MYQQTNLKKILTNGGVVIHLKILFRCSQLSLGPAKGVDHTILASLCHLLDPRGEGESVEYATQGVCWESGSLRRRGSRKVSPSRSDDYMYDRSSNHVISAFRLVARWPSCEGR